LPETRNPPIVNHGEQGIAETSSARSEEKVDELPKLMEDNPDTAIFVEKVKD
jgi:hypothetical protein